MKIEKKKPGPAKGYKQSPEHIAKRAAAKTILDPQSKVCGRCEKDRPAPEYKRRPNGRTLASYCRPCEKTYNAEKAVRSYWKNQEPEQVAKRHTANRKVALRQYGLTPEDYDRMLEKQDGGCAICGTAEPGGRSRYLHVDHCHATNDVRGLLCGPCNLGLGSFRDDPTLLTVAAEYLIRPRFHLTT
jgi:hypothetical protein